MRLHISCYALAQHLLCKWISAGGRYFLDNLPILRQAFRRICNPSLKNDLTYLCSADLESAAGESVMYYGLGDYKSPGLIGRTFFYDGLQIRRDA